MNYLSSNRGLNRSESSDIEVSILTCPYDTDFLSLSVAHLAKSFSNTNVLKTLLVDWMPASGFYATVYPERQESRFEEICALLLSEGSIDRVVRIPYEYSSVAKFLEYNVSGKFRVTHNIRGYPIYGSMYGVLSSPKRYFVHFDSDMLIHQGSKVSWVNTGISLLQKYSDIGAIMPKGGPPTLDGSINQKDYLNDSRGFHSFASFSSRVFLVDVQKFRDLHPVKPLWLGRFDRLRSLWDGKGQALSWESIVTNAFLERKLLRVDLRSNDSWSLHPPIKDRLYLKYLPEIISAVEEGRFPSEQAGNYDLDLKWWISYLH